MITAFLLVLLCCMRTSAPLKNFSEKVCRKFGYFKKNN